MTTGVAESQHKHDQAQSKSSYRYISRLQFAIISCLILVLFTQVLAGMAHDWWEQPDLSQGMLLPPLALLITWAERRRISSYPSKGDRRGLLLIAFACSMLVLGELASEFFLMRFSFVVLVTGLIWTFWGTRRLRTLAFPLLLLAVMVPLPAIIYNMVAEPLQLFASSFGSQIAQALGVSVFCDGNVIQLAHISLGVEEACSGLSCLSALIVGGLLLGYFLCRRAIGRVLLVVLAIPLAIGVNVIRIAGTAVLADYNQEFAMGFYHMFSGWLVFVAGAAVLYGIAQALHKLLDPREAV